jgi:hypothetical protein
MSPSEVDEARFDFDGKQLKHVSHIPLYEQAQGDQEENFRRVVDDMTQTRPTYYREKFTASHGKYFNHNLGTFPAVTVMDSHAKPVVVNVRHETANWTRVDFPGQTFTDFVFIATTGATDRA